VVDSPAHCVDAADPRTGVHAVQVDTGQGRRAVRIDCAFWPTCNVGVAEILGNALACSSSCPTRASSIAPTGGGVAGVYHFSRCKWSSYPLAGSKGISLIARVAATLRDVVGDGAGGVVAAHPRARIHAVLVHTGKVARTLSVDHALRLTLDVWVASIVPDAGTTGRLADLPAHGIDTTW